MSKGYLFQNDDFSHTVDARIQTVICGEVGGILKGQAVYATEVVMPVVLAHDTPISTVKLADIAVPESLPILGLAHESAAFGDDLHVINNGILDHVDTSTWSAGDLLYLNSNGDIDNGLPTGIEGTVQVGTVIESNVTDGAIQVKLEHFVATADFGGILRSVLHNTNDGENAAAAFTTKNDADRYTSIGINSSGTTFFGPNNSFVFNNGYGDMLFAIDGNKDFGWVTDVTDSHNLSATRKMFLTAAGFLGFDIGGVSIDRFLDEDDMASDLGTALPTQQSVKAYASHDKQEITDIVTKTTTSNTFVDIPGATLTAKDLGQNGNYTITFLPIVAGSAANTLISFQILLNGGPSSFMPRVVLVKTSNTDIAFPISGIATGIQNGDVLQVQWLTDKGTADLSQYTLMVDGIPESRVVA